jgi:hypothetical protein
MDTDGEAGTGGPGGPVGGALAGLAGWLASAAGGRTPVVTELPDGGDAARICLWPLALLPERTGGGSSVMAAVRLRARFVVIVEGPVDAALSIVDRLLWAVAEPGGYQPVPEPVDPALWLALGVPARPALQFDVPLRLDRPVPAPAPPARRLRVDGAPLRPLRGRVVGPGGIGLPGVQVSAGDTVTRTDPYGEFVLSGVAGETATVLQLSGKGRYLRAEVPAGSTDAVVVHCDIEEV